MEANEGSWSQVKCRAAPLTPVSCCLMGVKAWGPQLDLFPLKRQKSGFYKKINLFLRNVISQLNNLTRAISRKAAGAVCV